MSPTLLPGDVLLTVAAVGPVQPLLAPGRVVLLADPQDDDHLVIKRILAVDGTQLWLRGDDPTRSTDSRTWGWVEGDRVRRLAVRRWPQVRTPLWRDVQ